MDEDGALFDARFDDGGPFRDTPEPGGISLESALRDFGPAALDDLIPRVRVLARALDAAHSRGAVHGALNPSKIIITDEGTSIIRGLPPEASAKGGDSSYAPYVAPEVSSGERPTAASDQFSLAAITYEWLFGKRIDGPAHRTVAVKAMPEVDRAVLAKAFTRALAFTPEVRFASCMEFCDALAAAAVPELPLLMGSQDDAEEIDAIGPFVPEDPAAAELPVPLVPDDRPAPNIDDVKIVAEETNLTAAQPDFDAIAPIAAVEAAAPVSNWNPPPSSSREPARFGGGALIVAALVGALFGFAGGYMARPRALQSGPAETFAPQPETSKPAESAPAATVPPESASKEIVPAPAAPKVSPKTERPASRQTPPPRTAKRAAPAPSAPPPTAKPVATTGGLIVDSRPVGARVSINGKPSGTTPLTIDLPPGEYRVMMTLPGFRNFATTVRVVAGERVRAAYSLTAQEQE